MTDKQDHNATPDASAPIQAPTAQWHSIAPAGALPTIDLKEVWERRELLWLFTKRGVFSRYRQHALGLTWSLLEPLGQLLLMSLVFGLLIKVPTDGYPFPVYVFAALIPWLYFAKATNGAAASLSEQLHIISKIYFPRVILPIAAVAREFFDSIVLFVLLVFLAWGYGYPPSWKLLLMPILLAYMSIPALGLGMSVSAIAIKYRDFRPTLAISLQAVYYASPVFYSGTAVPPWFLHYYQLNPIYWCVEISRWIVLDKTLTLSVSFPISIAISLVTLVAGYFVFAVYERGTVDAQ